LCGNVAVAADVRVLGLCGSGAAGSPSALEHELSVPSLFASHSLCSELRSRGDRENLLFGVANLLAVRVCFLLPSGCCAGRCGWIRWWCVVWFEGVTEV
jgi:hypothetical protein